jgi:alkanesulfonate monooxygenase
MPAARVTSFPRISAYGEPLAGTAKLIDSVKQIAESAGRATPPVFVARLTVIPAATDSLAWDRAYSYLERAGGLSDGSHLQPPVSEGRRRIRAAAAEEERHDLAMWTVVGRNWGATLNALVGSPATIARALLEYVRLGVTGFRIHVFDYMADTGFVGRELIPLVRADAASITAP